jgi:hypothetical protein
MTRIATQIVQQEILFVTITIADSNTHQGAYSVGIVPLLMTQICVEITTLIHLL